MKREYDYWIPDVDTHFQKELKRSLKRTGIAEYQHEIRSEALKYVKDFNRFVDIGANLGLWSKPLSEKFNEGIAFEPLPFAIECLKENTKGKNILINEFCLGNINSNIEMVVWPNNTGKSHINNETLGKGNIPIKRLDDLNLPFFSFIKLDCEGYESEVLKGGLDTLKEYKPVVVIEQHPVSKYQAGDILKSIGAEQIFNVRHDYLFVWN